MPNFLRWDSEKRRLYEHVTGTWMIEDALAYSAQAGPVLRRALQSAGPITFLSDFTDLKVVSSDVAELLDPIVEMQRKLPIERYAAVTSSALMRMQIRRMMGSFPCTFFDNKNDAMDWLGWPPEYLAEKP
jgi:hypothetical protein